MTIQQPPPSPPPDVRVPFAPRRILADRLEPEESRRVLEEGAIQPARQVAVREGEEIRRDRGAGAPRTVERLARFIHALHEVSRRIDGALEPAGPRRHERTPVRVRDRGVEADGPHHSRDVGRPRLSGVGLDHFIRRQLDAARELEREPVVERGVLRGRVDGAQHPKRDVHVAEVRVALAREHRGQRVVAVGPSREVPSSRSGA